MEDLFRREERGRGAYLARLFAFFSEEVGHFRRRMLVVPRGRCGALS